MPNRVRTAKVILQVIGWLNIATAAVVICIFVAGAFALGLTGEERTLLGSFLLGGFGLALGLGAALVGVLKLVAARGLVRQRPWGRVLGIILGILMIPGLPFGTVFGIVVLTGLTSEEARTWFNPVFPPPAAPWS
ncbi:MAG: hypothetical protein OEW05_07360 [Candidatus Aminicenantes bacterium]|nr:hypothetical protein [Candidatus Aminicenantes bacterium]